MTLQQFYDFFGNPLFVGDVIVYSGRHHFFNLGVIKKFRYDEDGNLIKIQISWLQRDYRSNSIKSRSGSVRIQEVIKISEDLLEIIDRDYDEILYLRSLSDLYGKKT